MGRSRQLRGPKLGSFGELVPQRGFSRHPVKQGILARQSRWQSHDGLIVVSSLDHAYLPGSGDPPKVGPQWLVSVSVRGQQRRCTPEEAQRVADCFAMPAFDEDNHHPGVARHLWCPIDARYQQACECKLNEVTVTDGDYSWTTEDGACRGCEYELLSGLSGRLQPCPIHRPVVARG
jgi:hypothetical protein